MEARIAACLADISEWRSAHHLKLKLDKTELMFLPGKGCPHRDLAIAIDNAVVMSTRTALNLGVTLDDRLSFSANIASVTRTGTFLLYNIRRIHPFLTEKAAQVLIQALVMSRLDYCNSLLAGAPASAMKPLELVLSESCGSSGVQPPQVHPHNYPSPFSALNPYSIQWNSSFLPPGYGQALHPCPTTSVCCLEATGFPIAQRSFWPFYTVTVFLGSGPTVVE